MIRYQSSNALIEGQRTGSRTVMNPTAGRLVGLPADNDFVIGNRLDTDLRNFGRVEILREVK